jgi:hypothetical protein
MPKYKTTSIEGKAILQNLSRVVEGEIFELPGLLPGLPGKTECLVLKEAKGEWRLQLIAYGVPFAKVWAKVSGSELSLEELK